MTEYKLTEHEINNLLKYLELVRSTDKESIILGITIFYDDFKDFKLPIIYDDGCLSYIMLEEVDINLEIILLNLNSKFCVKYWSKRIADLLIYNYYIL